MHGDIDSLRESCMPVALCEYNAEIPWFRLPFLVLKKCYTQI